MTSPAPWWHQADFPVVVTRRAHSSLPRDLTWLEWGPLLTRVSYQRGKYFSEDPQQTSLRPHRQGWVTLRASVLRKLREQASSTAGLEWAGLCPGKGWGVALGRATRRVFWARATVTSSTAITERVVELSVSTLHDPRLGFFSIS